MNVKEYGRENAPVVILLHGGGLSWWNYKEVAALLQRKYHVVVPLLDGHPGSDHPFTTIEENAAELCCYIRTRFGGQVLAIGGLSLGGQILVETLSQAPDICRFALIESALVIPMPFTNKLLRPSIEMSYGLIKKRWFAKLQFAQLKMKKELFEDYYRDTCQITQQDMIAFLKCNSAYRLKPSFAKESAKTIVAVGEKEQKTMRDSARLLQKAVPGSNLLVLPGYYHGDLSINHAAQYVELLELQMT